jgi:hypothetical protein
MGREEVGDTANPGRGRWGYRHHKDRRTGLVEEPTVPLIEALVCDVERFRDRVERIRDRRRETGARTTARPRAPDPPSP